MVEKNQANNVEHDLLKCRTTLRKRPGVIPLNRIKITAAKSSLAASGRVSTASMAACCAHYLVAFLPAFGLSFFSAAAAGLAEYQWEFFFLGVISNIFGIVVMIRTMNKNRLISAGVVARALTIGL